MLPNVRCTNQDPFYEMRWIKNIWDFDIQTDPLNQSRRRELVLIHLWILLFTKRLEKKLKKLDIKGKIETI